MHVSGRAVTDIGLSAAFGQAGVLHVFLSIVRLGMSSVSFAQGAVEAHYTIANGYTADAAVVYGDTDSVMVKFGITDAARAMELGKEAADRVTKLFPPPVKLEFEKIYFPFLLMNKKRSVSKHAG